MKHNTKNLFKKIAKVTLQVANLYGLVGLLFQFSQQFINFM